MLTHKAHLQDFMVIQLSTDILRGGPLGNSLGCQGIYMNHLNYNQTYVYLPIYLTPIYGMTKSVNAHVVSSF